MLVVPDSDTDNGECVIEFRLSYNCHSIIPNSLSVNGLVIIFSNNDTIYYRWWVQSFNIRNNLT